MRHAAATFALLLLCCGCGTQSSTSRTATRAADSVAAVAAAAAHPLVNRIWALDDSTSSPGPILIFFADGTLVMDSCWEVYRLVPWQWESDSVVVWQEDAAEIRAAIMEVGADELVLRLDTAGGSQVEHFRTAAVPYLCPDLER